MCMCIRVCVRAIEKRRRGLEVEERPSRKEKVVGVGYGVAPMFAQDVCVQGGV